MPIRVIAVMSAALFAAAAVAVAPLPARAAMPVGGLAVSSGGGGDIVQVAKKKKKSARKSELDRSVDSGTVPSRYRSSVPKQYHQYIPFEKGR